MNYCKCGCKIPINPLKNYVLGHNNKGKSNYWKIKNKVKERTLHERANKLCKETECRLNNKDCKGPLDVAHLDKNNKNNSIENLAKLCRAHHFLLDKRNLTLEELKNMKLIYYIDKNGKRRYEF